MITNKDKKIDKKEIKTFDRILKNDDCAFNAFIKFKGKKIDIDLIPEKSISFNQLKEYRYNHAGEILLYSKLSDNALELLIEGLLSKSKCSFFVDPDEWKLKKVLIPILLDRVFRK